MSFGEKKYNPLSLEDAVMDFWAQNQIYKKVKKLRENGKQYYFLDGPPYVTGYIHLGTAWNKTLKDLYIRYLRMNGYNVRDQPGWDMHGLPIEVLVEQKMGIKHKKEIETKIGMEKFLEECKKFALKNLEIMEKQFKRLGVWMDWENPYRTINRDYMESEWWTIKKAWEKGLIDRDYRVVHWCPRCETALADHEIEYKELTDPSIYVKFPLEGKDKEYVLVWTTTPWTLPANLAVMVHPEYTYVKVKVVVDGGEEFYWLAKSRVEDVMNETKIGNYEIVETVKGEELIGLKYVYPLLDEMPRQKEFEESNEYVHRLVESEFVTLTEGTGFVHTAPGHGEEDYEVGKRYGLPVYSPIDHTGSFTEGKWKGMYVKDADKHIVETLKDKGLLLQEGKITHRYPTCWRCRSPLLFRATEQWFLRVSKIKDDILRENHKHVTWLPNWVKKRYEDGVKNVGDWCISRQRYWNTPMPIWKCEKCGNITVIGSVGELRSKAKNELPEDIDLHRSTVDNIVLKCDKCGGDMHRIPDVLDVWIDSGICSWASLGYPREKEKFEKFWPADFIIEGQDQILKWFYSQQVLSVVAFDTVPYKKVAMHGFVLDLSGSKMSKSRGNVVTPEQVIEKYGADTLRLYLLSSSSPWEDLRFNWEAVKEIKSGLDTLWNVYILAKTYMELDNFTLEKVTKEVMESLRVEDKWILSRVNSLIKDVERAINTYYLAKAVRAIMDFVVEDLSRWYGKIIRRRLWIESDDPVKLAAYLTLYRVFEKLLPIMAPFVPFITEALYQSLVRKLNPSLPESVHMLDWPKSEGIDEGLEEKMDIARRVYTAVASARQRANIKMRWPIRRVIVDTKDDKVVDAINSLKDILLELLNTKTIEFRNVKKWYSVKPNKNQLGKKFKKKARKIMEYLGKIDDATKLRSLMRRDGEAKIEIDGQEYVITREDVEFELATEEDLVGEETKFGYIFIDKQLDEELLSEGYARDVVRRIQEMRKRMDLDIEEFINVTLDVDTELKQMLEKWIDYIKNETRAKKLEFGEAKGYTQEWKIHGKKVMIGIERMN
ncbi:MAG: isoleucine--tRNA ligase [Candidatus Njordarchaeia archaeon]